MKLKDQPNYEHRLSISFPKEMTLALANLAKSQGQSYAAQVRYCVAESLRNRGLLVSRTTKRKGS